jgi:hypothetical protein
MECVMLLARLLSLSVFAAALSFGQSIDLLPDESLKGWTRIPIPPTDGLKPKLQWRVDAAQHALVCAGDGQHEWLRYDQILGDYILDVDFRFEPKGDVKYNSGIGIRLSQYGELWLQAQTGPSGGFLFGVNLVDGALLRSTLQKEMKENRIKTAGEWNHYQIRVQGDKVTLAVNGAVVNEAAGIALRKGYLGLEAEGHEIAFRNIKLTPLPVTPPTLR